MIASSKYPCDKAKKIKCNDQPKKVIKYVCNVLNIINFGILHRTCIFNSINLAVIGKK